VARVVDLGAEENDAVLEQQVEHFVLSGRRHPLRASLTMKDGWEVMARKGSGATVESRFAASFQRQRNGS